MVATLRKVAKARGKERVSPPSQQRPPRPGRAVREAQPRMARPEIKKVRYVYKT